MCPFTIISDGALTYRICPTIPRASLKLLNLNQEHPFKKIFLVKSL